MTFAARVVWLHNEVSKSRKDVEHAFIDDARLSVCEMFDRARGVAAEAWRTLALPRCRHCTARLRETPKGPRETRVTGGRQ